MRICDDLRQAVLQAAIQGKLTKQLPEDGNAKDLLKLINTEKKKLIKEKKIKKEKDLPQITEDEIPFDIPDSWEFIRLGDYLFIKSGNGLTSKDFKNGSIPVYGGNGITGYHNKSNVSKGTVLIGRVGFYCGSVHITVSDAWATDNALIVSYLDCFYKEYLVLMLKAMNLGHKTEQTAQPVVTGKIIKPKVVPLPPLAEQQRIVARVDELMARIDDLEKTETELEKLKSAFPGDMKAALLQAAMQGKLTEQLPKDGLENTKYSVEIDDSDIPFDIPDTWVWTQLGSLVNKDEIGDGDWVLSNDMCSKSNNNLIQLGSVGNGVYINKEFKHVSDDFFESKHCSELFEKDILISRFISKDHMNVCILPELPGRLFTAVDVCWIRNNPERYLNTWLMWCLLCRGVQSQVMSYVAGTTRKRVSKANLLKVFIPLPPLAEQKRIVEKLDKLLPLCDGLIEK